MGGIVALIPARAGSKSIPNKNTIMIAGKPLIHWVIESALKSTMIERVYVATDGKKIRNSVLKISNPKLKVIDRSPETATDTASTELIMIEFANRVDFKHLILLQPTSPLTSTSDIDNALNHYIETKSDSLLSLVRQKRFIWNVQNNHIKPMNYDHFNRPTRQNFSGFYVENGAIYISSRDALLLSGNRISGKLEYIEMDEKTYFELDEIDDIPIIESFLRRREINPIKNIKIFISDVDGVLTDSGMYYSEKGDELKKFNTRDGVAFKMLKKKGILTSIMTSEKTRLVKNRAKKLHIDILCQGVKDKLARLKDISIKYNIKPSEIAFIGDDINDTEVLKFVGLSACPADAIEQNLNIANFICSKKGGEGCVREFADYIIRAKN